MRRNEKIIGTLGIVIFVIALLGIFIYTDVDPRAQELTNVSEFIDMSGTFSQRFDGYSITVPDDDPFYALVATPLAVHYTSEGEQEIIPLYVKNLTNPSNAIQRIKHDQLRHLWDLDITTIKYENAMDFSLELARRYWEKSDAALIIKNDFSGYSLGVNAVPLASYLSAPVVICEKITDEVLTVLMDLEVEKIIICGDFDVFQGPYDYLKFDSVNQIVENTSLFVQERFGGVNYITLTNPIDAFPPEVVDITEYYFGPEPVRSASMNRQSTFGFLLTGGTVTWEFTIPSDYKYALIEFEGYNHDIDYVDEFADYAEFVIDPVKEGAITLGGSTTANGDTKRDRAGNIIQDTLYMENVLYDCGGETYRITASGSWTFLDEGRVSARVTIKKLDNPVYEMMGGLSSIAPYLTAYHKGIVFGNPSFAFTADDDVITDKGTTAPGYFLPGRNIDLVPLSNRHIIDNIHEPLNHLLANLAGLPYGRAIDLKPLTDHYKHNPVHIALVGGITVLPRYTYDNNIIPLSDTSFGIHRYLGGGGTHSDNIYANIDPVKDRYDNMVPDIHSSGDHPYLENIVGRIAGRDVQDANALILRSMFYDEILTGLSKWKENYGIIYGGGIDFRAPLWVQTMNTLPPFKWFANLAYSLSGGLINFVVGPWMYDTGFSRITARAMEYKIGDNLGFNTEIALHEEGMLDGLSYESLDKLKTASLWNRLTFSKSQVAPLVGEGNVKARDILENSNFIWLCGHGNINNIGLKSADLVSSGTSLFGFRLWQRIYKNLILPHSIVIFGPGGGLAKVGEYNPRNMADLEIGPSFLWVESCFVGRITGVTPQTSPGMALLQSGPAAMISSDSGSNIPGGYLPEKNFLFDTWIGTQIRYRQWERKAEENIYPDLHCGSKIYEDLCNHLSRGKTIGEAFRDAKNQYLPEDEDWELWWAPPLSPDGVQMGLGTHIASKYNSFLQYQLYGDPAFKPYMPGN